jgi:hypothetical protein
MSYYTSGKRNDGFGAQYQNIVWDILYTLAHGNRYVFTPVESFEHNYDSKTDFVDNLNKFMNLSHVFPQYDCNNNRISATPYTCRNQIYDWVQSNINTLIPSPSLEIVKQAFFADKHSPYDDSFHNICVHIRRFNQHDTRPQTTPDSYYINAIKKAIEDVSSSKPIRIHIISQGTIDDFTVFSNVSPENTKVYLDESVQDTFLKFVYADSLIIAPSSFSYIAAFLSSGKIYYVPFCHATHNSWTQVLP